MRRQPPSSAASRSGNGESSRSSRAVACASDHDLGGARHPSWILICRAPSMTGSTLVCRLLTQDAPLTLDSGIPSCDRLAADAGPQQDVREPTRSMPTTGQLGCRFRGSPPSLTRRWTTRRNRRWSVGSPSRLEPRDLNPTTRWTQLPFLPSSSPVVAATPAEQQDQHDHDDDERCGTHALP